jgi:hypothetical protein
MSGAPVIQNEGVQITDIHNPVQQTTGTKKRASRSFFQLTCNTNQRHNAYSLGLVQESQKLQSASEYVFTHLKEFVIIKKPGDRWCKSLFPRILTKGAIERGENKDQVHCHMMIFITHYSNIQLDLKKLKEHFCAATGLPNVYLHLQMHNRGGGDPEETLKNYLNKNMSNNG